MERRGIGLLIYIYNIYVHILFALISYTVWWGKLDKSQFFHIFQVYPFITAKFNWKLWNKWWNSESTLSCEEIDTSFDQIEQLLFKESNSWVIYFMNIFFQMNWEFLMNLDCLPQNVSFLYHWRIGRKARVRIPAHLPRFPWHQPSTLRVHAINLALAHFKNQWWIINFWQWHIIVWIYNFSKMAKNAIFRSFNPHFLENLTWWKVNPDSCSALKMPSWSHLICKTLAGLWY